VLLVGALLGCGGSDDDDDGAVNGSSNLVCAPDEFIVQGTLEGASISHRGNLQGHAWIQSTDYKSLDTPFEGGGSFHAEWPEVVADGDSTSITGTVTLPPSGEHGGETVSFAAGLMTKRDNGVSFDVSELAIEVTCASAPCPAEAASGALSGCVEWESAGP
jgi:hypothetical protein